MKNKTKKRGDVQTDKLIPAIIVVIVVVVVVIALGASISKGGEFDKFSSLLPTFLKTNSTFIAPDLCPIGYDFVGYFDQKQYLVLNGKKTNFYLKSVNDALALVIDPPGGFNSVVGVIQNEKIYAGFSDLENYDISYRKLFPSDEDRKLINGALIYQGALCLPLEQHEKVIETLKCVLNCKLVNGICSGSAVVGKVEYKTLDCPQDQMCYVAPSEFILTSDNMSINQAIYSRYIDKTGNAKVENRLDNAQKISTLNAKIFEKVDIYPIVDSNISFCYAFDSDLDKKFASSYYTPNDANPRGSNKFGLLSTTSSVGFTYSGDKFIQLIVWNNNNKQKLILRWKFNSEGMPSEKGHDDGKVIQDKDFGWEIRTGNVGNRFYVLGLSRKWIVPGIFSVGSHFTNDYKAEIISFPVSGTKSVCLYAIDTTQGAQGMSSSWHALYCNKGTYINTQPAYCMAASEIKDTLTETFDNSCSWEF